MFIWNRNLLCILIIYINGFTVTLDKFNIYLLNKSITFFPKNYIFQKKNNKILKY